MSSPKKNNYGYRELPFFCFASQKIHSCLIGVLSPHKRIIRFEEQYYSSSTHVKVALISHAHLYTRTGAVVKCVTTVRPQGTVKGQEAWTLSSLRILKETGFGPIIYWHANRYMPKTLWNMCIYSIAVLKTVLHAA